MNTPNPILRLAIPCPLRKTFDYLPPSGVDAHTLALGVRIKVSFGRRELVGVLLEVVSDSALERGALKPAVEVLDQEPLLDAQLLRLLDWASRYYHHPVGEVYSAALPVMLRQGTAAFKGCVYWRLTAQGSVLPEDHFKRAPKQWQVLQWLRAAGPAAEHALNAALENWRPVMKRLAEQGWVVSERLPQTPITRAPVERPALNHEQAQAVAEISAGLAGFHPFLLNGITGSGKTEVYLTLTERVIAAGRQVLVLVPEIGLTPQLVARFQERLAVPIAVLHSGLNDQERLDAWLMARDGSAPLVIGTRSAALSSFQDLGLIIVDEEHDASFKQQEGFRYSARDVAVMRARLGKIPIVLGSATPSLETLYNVAQNRYRELRLTQRAGNAVPPKLHALDVRHQPIQEGVSRPLLELMRQHLAADGQVLLFLNRRGFAPALLCHDCGWSAECKRCDTHMVLHQGERRLRCHHCLREIPLMPACPACGSAELRPVGHGTERIEELLKAQFPEYPICRLDRDTTRRKGALDVMLDEIRQGKYRILIGTQMVAKGHHFPEVTLVGILNAEQGLYSADFRGMERMAQQILQVAGRAGRMERPGTVVMQTHHPDHPLLQELLAAGYPTFAQTLLAERQQAELPPYTALALFRAEANRKELPLSFLEQVRDALRATGIAEVLALGPVMAPMERRAGRYRAQLLVQSGKRSALHEALDLALREVEGSALGRKVRWSLDVDPVETF